MRRRRIWGRKTQRRKVKRRWTLDKGVDVSEKNDPIDLVCKTRTMLMHTEQAVEESSPALVGGIGI